MTEREREIEAVLRAVLEQRHGPFGAYRDLNLSDDDLAAMARAVVEQIVELERKRDDLQATLDEIHTAIPATFYAGLGVPTFRVEELVRTWNNAVKATKQLEDQLAALAARLARLVEAAEAIKKMFHPKGPGHGTCLLCTKAGGEHFDGCPIGLTVTALADAGAGMEKK